jgi:hypothetical protein
MVSLAETTFENAIFLRVVLHTLTTSSLNGTNRGVLGASFTSSLNGMIEEQPGVFGTSRSLPLTLASGAASGGGIGSPSPGVGSLKTEIRDDIETAGADVTRCCRPGWDSVVPLSFDTLGTFSFMRSFRVPSSFHGVATVSSAASASSAEAPEGSTKTCIRAFGGLGLEDGPDPGPKTSSGGREDTVVDVECVGRLDLDVRVDSPRTFR